MVAATSKAGPAACSPEAAASGAEATALEAEPWLSPGLHGSGMGFQGMLLIVFAFGGLRPLLIAVFTALPV